MWLSRMAVPWLFPSWMHCFPPLPASMLCSFSVSWPLLSGETGRLVHHHGMRKKRLHWLEHSLNMTGSEATYGVKDPYYSSLFHVQQHVIGFEFLFLLVQPEQMFLFFSFFALVSCLLESRANGKWSHCRQGNRCRYWVTSKNSPGSDDSNQLGDTITWRRIIQNQWEVGYNEDHERTEDRTLTAGWAPCPWYIRSCSFWPKYNGQLKIQGQVYFPD